MKDVNTLNAGQYAIAELNDEYRFNHKYFGPHDYTKGTQFIVQKSDTEEDKVFLFVQQNSGGYLKSFQHGYFDVVKTLSNKEVDKMFKQLPPLLSDDLQANKFKFKF